MKSIIKFNNIRSISKMQLIAALGGYTTKDPAEIVRFADQTEFDFDLKPYIPELEDIKKIINGYFYNKKRPVRFHFGDGCYLIENLEEGGNVQLADITFYPYARSAAAVPCSPDDLIDMRYNEKPKLCIAYHLYTANDKRRRKHEVIRSMDPDAFVSMTDKIVFLHMNGVTRAFIALDEKYVKDLADWLFTVLLAPANVFEEFDVHHRLAAGDPFTEAEKRMKQSDETSQNEAENLQEQDLIPDAFEELDALIGLTPVKKDIRDLADLIVTQKKREKLGMKAVKPSVHLVFTGNPGTGKTTVARIVGKIYKQIGILSKGQVVEVDRGDLVGEFIGQTAIKTKDKIREALGGVLFIDEAYALLGDGKDYGKEAVNTLLKAMEDYRDDLVIIVAGYPEPMKQFINSNPGLQSRFTRYFLFEDFSEDELYEIFQRLCRQYDYILDESAAVLIRQHICALVENKQENFANAREIRTYFERIIARQSVRTKDLEDSAELSRICADDCRIEEY